jgi:hypothetical protein
VSRNFDLLQKIGKEQEIFQTELDPLQHHPMSCDLCRQCGLSVPENCLFCPKCGVFQGAIATEDLDGSVPELPQRASSFIGRLAVWLRVLKLRAARER